MTRTPLTVALLLLALALAATATARPETARGVVLGSRTSFEPYGMGWGTARPLAVDDGGDPSGKAWGLRWVGWGRATASATGFTYLAPSGRRGWRKGRLQFRASRIARCSTGGARAYTRLQIRVAELRSGAFGAWQLWNGRTDLCHS